MCTVKEIYDYIDGFAPFYKHAEWDNVGLLVGDGSCVVKRAAVVLDITPRAAEKAGELGCQLVISHHPIIFHPIKRLSSHDAPYILAQHGISAICAHTSLDAADGGVNDALTEAIGLEAVRPVCCEEEGGLAFGRSGLLRDVLTASELAAGIKRRLGAPRVDFSCGERPVKSVVVSSGAGADLYLDYCIENGIDAFVTSEVKHHQYLEAEQAGLAVIDAGHFCTERVICPALANRLRAAFPDVEFAVLDEAAPYQSI